MTDPVTRRRFVALGAGVAASSAFPMTAVAAKKRKEPLLSSGTFDLGVASGFPGTNEITLWSHVDGVGGNAQVRMQVARDREFKQLVVNKRVRVPEVRDHTVRARITTGLKPGEEYFYRFATRKDDSPVGRFKTLRPADSREPVKVAFFSCQDYQAGYYPVHRALAAEDDLDLVIGLGDYVYEQTYYDGPRKGMDKTGGKYKPDDTAYVVTLDEWRAKYKLYKADPQLQAMHAAHPYVSIWDDHEVEDNYAGAQRDPAKSDALQYSFADRRRNGYLAFFEYMPRLRAKPVDFRIYGSIPLGQTAEVFLTDERQYRDPQPCGDQLLVPCADAATPGRSFLGPTQKGWFKDAVVGSKAQWKLVANELMIMSLDSVPGQAINVDSWDGYAAERSEILGHFASNGVKNLSFMTGDIHTFFAGTVTTTGRTGGTPIGTEFVGGSVTSLGLEDTFGPAVAAVEPTLLTTNPHLAYAELKSRGYAVMTAGQDELRVEYKSPKDTASGSSPVSTLASFRVPSGGTRVERAQLSASGSASASGPGRR